MTKSELAASLGLKPRQIDNLVVEGLPRKKVGRTWIYGAEAESWYWRRKAQSVGSASRGQLDAARMRRELAQARKAEFDLEVAMAEWLRREDVEVGTRRWAELVNARLVAAPARWAYRWQAARSQLEAQQVLEEIVREIILDLKHTMLGGPRSNGKPADRRPGRGRRRRRR